eukprot:TRINITY_DN20794_c0_g1_i1.p1 TRINITY_DN20794_c0_g1~~TRINITY_DN20794_c0_g1_i1.p1  ORF type:complete len:610 (+),score=85.33 TRINITY_DN20794_c0_g1_i1:235-1830(+)
MTSKTNLQFRDLREPELLSEKLPNWVSQNHGHIKEWGYTRIDNKFGYLGVSSLLYSKLWFDTKHDGSRTILTGKLEQCMQHFRELLATAKLQVDDESDEQEIIPIGTNSTDCKEDYVTEEGCLSVDEIPLSASNLCQDLQPLSDVTVPTIVRAMRGLGTAPVYDFHVHCVGLQKEVTGCCLHEKIFSWKHPVNFTKHKFFMKGLGVTSLEDDLIDSNMIDRLQILTSEIASYLPGGMYRSVVLAFDRVYNKDGEIDHDKTAMYVPNDHVVSMCSKYPDHMIPACSIHPYRKDCVDELRRCHKLGIRIVKWLPNTQMIDPSCELCDPFYKAMKFFGMTLLCHTGAEHSITFCGVDDDLGNPLHLRRALDCGVRVILAHCASEGTSIDLDSYWKSRCNSIDLFYRMMAEKKYEELLFADISALTCFKRLKNLVKILDSTEIHSRLLYGSDYPVPCVPLVVQPSEFSRYGILSDADAQMVGHIRESNPLLANFVALRLFKTPKGNSFPDSVFHGIPHLLGEQHSEINLISRLGE